MLQSKNVSTLFSFDTEYSADSVEWCPHKPNQNVFVCANYQLKDGNSDEKRFGRILLFTVTEEGLKLHQTINTSAVLDQKWCHKEIDSNSLLGIVNAAGKIEIYKLNTEILELELICVCQIESEVENLILSLDWSTGILESSEPEIICSDSNGRIHLLKLNHDKLTLQSSWQGHEFEAWIAGFYYWNPNIFFSGGDDCILLKFDKRVGEKAVAKNKDHGAGVTSFHSNISNEHVVATGSYDEHIRMWDVRNMKCETNTIKMPGTLWRLKWDPFHHNYLLAACMLEGVHILDTTSNNMDIVGSYYGHENISYGADWSYLNNVNGNILESDGQFIIGTCSFYDHLLCISKFCPNKVPS